MPTFIKNNTARQPFGVNEYRRSTRAEKFDSAMAAASAQPVLYLEQKSATPTLRAITSNIATITTAAAHGFAVGDVVRINIGNAAFDGTWVIKTVPSGTTFTYERVNADVGSAAATGTVAVGGDSNKVLQPGTIMAKITSGGNTGLFGPFQAGATDGRQTTTNIVGINDTFLPWQLLEHDEQIAVLYDGTVVQAWCIEYDATGAPIPLSNTTRDAIIALPTLAILFK